MPSDTTQESDIKNKQIELIGLDDLLLDEKNPRFAEFMTSSTSQRDIVNLVVRQFGVDDVLSSIAVSGYFSAEPLVCRESDNGKYTVVEGNRRLAAMLILSRDERAIDHEQRSDRFRKVHEDHGSPEYSPVPCIVFRDGDSLEALLSYLGVRHIVSTKEWDSYAKAAWVANALKVSNLSLTDIAKMIGDERGTVQRLISGYHFVDQLTREGRFNPKNSIRRGRGSNTSYPFSWVYTILGYSSVSQFVGLSENPEEANPIPKDKLDNAELLLRSMFGDSSSGISPAIPDSRNISNLARIVSDRDKVLYLKQGKNVEEIERLTRPLADVMGEALLDVLQQLRDINVRLEEEPLSIDDATQLLRLSKPVLIQAEKLQKIVLEHSSDKDPN